MFVIHKSNFLKTIVHRAAIRGVSADASVGAFVQYSNNLFVLYKEVENQSSVCKTSYQILLFCSLTRLGLCRRWLLATQVTVLLLYSSS